jgi:hypothetical protein
LGIYKGICRESNALFVLQIFFWFSQWEIR